MPIVKFDVSDQDPNESTAAPEPPPPGLYKAKIVQCKSGYKAGPDGKPDKAAGRLEVIYEVIKSADGKNPKVTSGRVYDYVTFYETTRRKYDMFLQSLGLATKTKRTGGYDPEKQVGKIVKLRVSSDTNQSGEYKAKVGGTWKWDGGSEEGTPEDDGLEGTSAPVTKATKATKKTAKPAAEEVSLEELGEAADGGDEGAVAQLTELAEAAGEDPDFYSTWAELAEALGGGGDTEGEEAEPEEEGVTLEALGEAADENPEGDEAAKLTELAEANGLDPNDYETWAEVATLLEEAGVDPNTAEEDPF